MQQVQPYRSSHATPPTPLRPPGVPAPRSLQEAWFGDAVSLQPTGDLVAQQRTWPLHVVGALSSLGPGVAFGIWLASELVAGTYRFDGSHIGLALLCLVFLVIFGWIWHAGLRGVRVRDQINAWRLDDAERALGGGRFGQGLEAGLIAQLRGDHDGAARAFLGLLKSLDLRSPAMAAGAVSPVSREMRARSEQIQGVTALNQAACSQAASRAAVALASLGRISEATAVAHSIAPVGKYNAALSLVASAYLQLAKNEPLPPEQLAALEQTFSPLPGSWGGLILAAYGYAQLGDMSRCRALVAEEKTRVHADRLAPALPLVAHWAERGHVMVATPEQPLAPPTPVATETVPAASTKSWVAALMLCVIMGFFGAHRFYVGKRGTGLLMLLTLGGLGMWQIVDIILIFLGKFTDQQGMPLRNLHEGMTVEDENGVLRVVHWHLQQKRFVFERPATHPVQPALPYGS